MKRIYAGVTAGALVLLFSAFTGSAVADEREAAYRLETVRQNYLAQERTENWKKNGSFEVEAKAADSGHWLAKASASSVNMVTNTSCADAKGMEIAGKTYYVPEGYTGTLLANRTLRYANDPFTGKRVDKGAAVIYTDASGRAYYFESEETYRRFISLDSTAYVKAY